MEAKEPEQNLKIEQCMKKHCSHWLTSILAFFRLNLDRVSYNTAVSPRRPSRAPEDTRDHRRPHTHTPGVWRSHLTHSCGNTETTGTRGKGHLGEPEVMVSQHKSGATHHRIHGSDHLQFLSHGSDHSVHQQKKRKRKRSIPVPRQSAAWQSWVSLSGPVQCVPLFRGGGLMQARVRICVLFPHVTGQSDHTDHGVHPPSTNAITQHQWYNCV